MSNLSAETRAVELAMDWKTIPLLAHLRSSVKAQEK
jgi:hypothetical protein